MVDAGLPVAAEHLQVLQRLKQLTAWQQAQQERLRAHQQEQIAKLRGNVDPEPSRLLSELRGPPLRVSPGPLTGEQDWGGLVGEREEVGEGVREEELVRVEGSVCDSGLGTGGHDSEEERSSEVATAGEDRPIQPGVGESHRQRERERNSIFVCVFRQRGHF